MVASASRVAARTQGLIIAGIDEAGYGPRVGPLCVGLGVVRLDDSPPLDRGRPPDLWRRLGAAVCREPDRSGVGPVAINDSKRLKGANASVRQHPLRHLERGVLAAMAAAAPPVRTDDDLLRALGARPGADAGAPWYDGPPIPLPLAATPDQQRLANVRLASGLAKGGAAIADLRCATLAEPAFNRMVRERGGKASASFALVGAHLRRVWRSRAAALGGPPPIVVIDRQGGRTDYREALGAALPRASVRETMRTPERSAYQITSGERAMRVIVMVKADAACLACSLASMIAKYVRELAMIRFNRFWAARFATLRPTAGYGRDARRWLDEIRPRLPAREFDRLRRQA